MEIVASISRALDVMDTQAAMPGIAAYAEAQHGGTGYNVAAEWTEARAALDAVRAWLGANIRLTPSRSCKASKWGRCMRRLSLRR